MEAEPFSVEPWRDPEVVAEIAERYHYNLPFHNWQHATGVLENAYQNASRCADNGLFVDADVITAASLFHDAGYWLEPGKDHGFATKERFSAEVAALHMDELGMPEDKVSHVKNIILSTQRGAKCESLEARCVRQADLSNVASRNPLFFLRNTYNLYTESKQLAGHSVLAVGPDEFIRFCRVSYDILCSYLDEDISLGPFDLDTNNQSHFHNRAAKNVSLLLQPERLVLAWNKLTSKH